MLFQNGLFKIILNYYMYCVVFIDSIANFIYTYTVVYKIKYIFVYILFLSIEFRRV